MQAPFALGRSPRFALVQGLAFAAFFYVFMYGRAFATGVDERMKNILLGAGITGALMLSVMLLCLRNDSDKRTSTGLVKEPLVQSLLFGGLGVAAAYAVNIVLGLVAIAVRGNPMGQAQEKAAWASKVDVPLWAVVPLALFVGFWEETVFRGFLLGRFRAAFAVTGTLGKRDVWAVLLTAALFGGAHGYQGALGILQTTLIGITLGLLTVWRKSVWPAVIAHATIDTVGLVALQVLKPVLERLSRGEPPLG